MQDESDADATDTDESGRFTYDTRPRTVADGCSSDSLTSDLGAVAAAGGLASAGDSLLNLGADDDGRRDTVHSLEDLRGRGTSVSSSSRFPQLQRQGNGVHSYSNLDLPHQRFTSPQSGRRKRKAAENPGDGGGGGVEIEMRRMRRM